jgi:hypothetical protein
MKKSVFPAGVLAGVLFVSGCAALRLGGGGPIEYTSIALNAGNAPAADVAAQIRTAAADLVLLSGVQDSAWFADVAAQTGLQLTGPGRTGDRSLGFLTRLELLGDTSMVLPVPGGGQLHMHDALYRVDRDRVLDLMYIRMDEPIDIGAATRALLEYIATDVGATAALLLAIESPRPAAADSVAIRLRALYPTVWECTEPGRRGEAPPSLNVRLFFGPSVRVRCREARQLTGLGAPVAAQLIIER